MTIRGKSQVLGELACLLGRRIRELRQERGWGQVDLAEYLDGRPKQATLSTIETGRRFPSYRTLEKLVRAFGVVPAALFLSPGENFRHRVAVAVLECSEETLRHVAKLVDVDLPPR